MVPENDSQTLTIHNLLPLGHACSLTISLYTVASFNYLPIYPL